MNVYQGLFLFVSGLATYIIMLLSLRLIASKNEESNDVESDDSELWPSKEELMIVDIIQQTHDIKTFRFKRKNGGTFFKFLPGQFLGFQIKDDSKLLRSYSISGSCENQSTLQVSIKKLKDGIGSGWFHSLAVGDTVWAYPPSGLFTDENLDLDCSRVYVGGGIGITPLISMIKTSLDRAQKVPLALFYGMNSVDDMAFHQELTVLSKTYNNFKYFPILSNPDDSWSGDSGYITYDYISSKLAFDLKAHFYFCGPPIMTTSIMDSLGQSNHPVGNIHSEKFVSPEALDSSKVEAKETKISIGGKDYNYNGSQTILEFLEEQNVDISFACRSGVCGSCKSKLIKGKVDSLTDSGLSSEEVSEGYILTCVSRPEEDIKLEIS